MSMENQSQQRSRSLILRLLMTGVLASTLLLQSGCNVVILLGYLISGPPSIEPDFHKKTNLWLNESGKTTAVICYAPKRLKWDNENVDAQVAQAVAYQFRNHKIATFDPDRVSDWVDQNPDYDKVTELGTEFKLDYVVHIDIKDYSLFAPQSSDLYQGRCEAIINVFKMNEDKSDGELIYTTEVNSKFPTRSEKSVYDISMDDFRNLYLEALSDEIGRKFYESQALDDISKSALQ